MKAKLYTLLALALLAITGCAPKLPQGTGSTLITFFDVGEGAATLIDSPDLGRILIDTGNPSSRLISQLKHLGVQSIDKLILTHPHPDHIGGAFAAIELLRPKLIYDNGEILNEENPMERWYVKTIREHPNYRALSAGESFDSGATQLKILSPAKLLKDWNTNSLVILFSTSGRSVLLMADGNSATEQFLLRAKVNLKSDILQVGHHGAEDASSTIFLANVSPKYAIVSVNRENINGYPATSTLQKLSHIGATVYLTKEHGTTSFKISSDGIITAKASLKDE